MTEEIDPESEIEPFASQRIRVLIFCILTTIVLGVAIGIGRVFDSYLYAAALGIIGSHLLDFVLERLQYPNDSAIPWKKGQQE